MSNIDDACLGVVNTVEGAIACAVVDLESGTVLGIHKSAQLTQNLDEIVASATVDMFRGGNIGRVKHMVRVHCGETENEELSLEEVHVASMHNSHFAKTLRNGRLVVILVMKKTTNIGMGWAMLKSVLPTFESLVS